MPDTRPQVDGARVLADLHALRGIGTYKTGVHKPTFSEPHMRSLEWLAQRLPEAALAADIDAIGIAFGTSPKHMADAADISGKRCLGKPLRKPLQRAHMRL